MTVSNLLVCRGLLHTCSMTNALVLGYLCGVLPIDLSECSMNAFA